MTTLNLEMTKNETIDRELSLDELDNTSGGFIWIAAVVGGFAVGTAIRAGIDWLFS